MYGSVNDKDVAYVCQSSKDEIANQWYLNNKYSIYIEQN